MGWGVCRVFDGRVACVLFCEALCAAFLLCMKSAI